MCRCSAASLVLDVQLARRLCRSHRLEIMAQNPAAVFHPPSHIPIAFPTSRVRIQDEATSQYPFFAEVSAPYAKTSLADGTDFDGSEVETKNGACYFFDRLLPRGGYVPSLSSDCAAHLLSFTIRWGIVPARVRRYPSPPERSDALVRDRLARQRTELANERTLLS